jgi:hypothetical protein
LAILKRKGNPGIYSTNSAAKQSHENSVSKNIKSCLFTIMTSVQVLIGAFEAYIYKEKNYVFGYLRQF